MLRSSAFVVLGLALAGCDATEQVPIEAAPTAKAASAEQPAFEGTWRAALTSPGGELPFEIQVRAHEGGLKATARNGTETIDFSSAAREGRELVLRIDGYDSEIRATLDEAGNRWDGTWTKTTPKGPSSMPLVATRGAQPRFATTIEEPAHPVPTAVDGEWSLVFREDDESTYVAGRSESARRPVQGGGAREIGDGRPLSVRVSRRLGHGHL